MSIELPPGVEREEPQAAAEHNANHLVLKVQFDPQTGRFGCLNNYGAVESMTDILLKRARYAALDQFVESERESGVELTITYDRGNPDSMAAFSFVFAAQLLPPSHLDKEIFIDWLIKKAQQQMDMVAMQQAMNGAQQSVQPATAAMLGGMRAPNGRKR